MFPKLKAEIYVFTSENSLNKIYPFSLVIIWWKEMGLYWKDKQKSTNSSIILWLIWSKF